MKKVSVIIPAYNKADLTVETVESVLSQTYKNIEVIVIDDGSTDNTRERLLPFTDKIKYVYKENGGACSARNVGVKLSAGEYIGFIDCDDLYLPEKVRKSVDYLEKNHDCGFVHTAAYFINKNGEVVSKYSHPQSRQRRRVYERLLNRNFICNSTVIIRRECLDKVGMFDESVFTPADWDMWLRLAREYCLGYIDEPLTKYRVSGSFIFNNLDLAEKEELQVVSKSFQYDPNTLGYIRNRVLSNLYRRFAANYFLNNEIDKAKQRFRMALGRNFLDFKTLAMYFCFLFNRQYLRRKLKERIFLEY